MRDAFSGSSALKASFTTFEENVTIDLPVVRTGVATHESVAHRSNAESGDFSDARSNSRYSSIIATMVG